MNYRKIARRYAIYLAVSAGISIVFCPTCIFTNFRNFLIGLIFSMILFVSLAEGIGLIMKWLDRIWPWQEGPRKRFFISLPILLIYCIVVIILAQAAIEIGFEGQQLDSLFSWSFYRTVLINTLVAIIITLFIFAYSFVIRWGDLAEQHEKHKNKNLYAHIESLQNQIKPHFLFNNLNTVTSIIPDDPDTAIKFINQLSNVYRYILDHQNDELVSLGTEVEFAKAYAYLMEIRYGEKINFDWAMEGAKSKYIPPYSLQLLIENAIKHNIISKSKPLSITLKVDENMVVVSNNLQLKKAEGSSWGIGLGNIRERYSMLSSQKVVVLEEQDSFIVKLPLLELS